MFVTFFSLFIWPIQAVIQVLFLSFTKVFSGNQGLTIIAISLAVNTLLLPIYNVADRWQSEERDLLARMRKKVKDIRAVFQGDQRQMVLGTYYRQMGYHPLFSLRSSVGLLIQIPFFLAAYDFLAHLEALRGVSFLFLKDLSQPDALIAFGGVSINVLPFVMTAFNLVSAFLYTKGLQRKDKIQLLALATVFLVLLYGSPSGLVLYWTVSNIFSLGKNMAHSLKRPGRFFHVLVLVGTSLAVLLPSVGLIGPVKPKLWVVAAVLIPALAVVPWVWRTVLTWGERGSLRPGVESFRVLLLGAVNLTLLTGLVIPALLIGSSPTEFDRTWFALAQTFLQSTSLFLLIPLAAWGLADRRVRGLLGPATLGLVVFAVLNCFAFPSRGTLNRTFDFTDATEIRSRWDLLWTLVSCSVALVASGLLWKFVGRVWVLRGLTISALALAATGAVTLYSVSQVPVEPPARVRTSVEPVFHLSKTHHNLFVVYLDRATGAVLPKALEKDPGLAAKLDGFVFYPNTVSFGQCTILGAPAVLGGYEYTPQAMAARPTETVLSKVNEALKVLPTVFGDRGYRVTFTDPVYANLVLDRPDVRVFDGLKNVTAVNLKSEYKALLLKELGYQQDLQPEHQRFDYDILERFSVYRIAPPLLRDVIYKRGVWWHANKVNNDFDQVMKSYAALHFFSALTAFDADQPTLNLFINETTHENGAFGPDLKPTPWDSVVPPEDLALAGDEESALYLYNFAASLEAVAAWFETLKAQGVWDTTKIIVVADHGNRFANSGIPGDGFERFNPLLLVKDYRARGPLQVSHEFMTNAEVVPLLTQELGTVSNPATGKPLTSGAQNRPLQIFYGPSSTPGHDVTVLPFTTEWEFSGQSLFETSSWRELPPR